MESLARIDHFDFDDTALASSHGIYGVHAERAITDEPRHYSLSHWLHPFSMAEEGRTSQGGAATHTIAFLPQCGFSHRHPMGKGASRDHPVTASICDAMAICVCTCEKLWPRRVEAV
jgi:hypothetical protein